MLVPIELGCESGRCCEMVLVGLVRHVSHANLPVRVFCDNLLPQYSQVRDLEEAVCVVMFAMVEIAVREKHHGGGGIRILATCENEVYAIAPERSKISHAMMHKADACMSLNGQMHDLAVEQSSWKGKVAKV